MKGICWKDCAAAVEIIFLSFHFSLRGSFADAQTTCLIFRKPFNFFLTQSKKIFTKEKLSINFLLNFYPIFTVRKLHV